MTYSELKTAIADYLHRTDLTTQIPQFIERAEANLFREINIKDLRISVTGTTTGEYITLPADFSEVVKVTCSYGGTEYNLDYGSKQFNPSVTAPMQYVLENNKLRLFGTSTGQAYTLYYTPKMGALSDSNTTNWLLANASDLYLYASSLEAARYMRDQAQEDKLSIMVAPLIDSIKRYTERKGQPTSGSLPIRTRRTQWD
jgi:hypothetical protein